MLEIQTPCPSGPQAPATPFVHELAEHWADIQPGAIALTDPAGEITYAELVHTVDEYAAILIELGVQRGDRVALLSKPRSSAFAAYLAVASIGGVFQGLNPANTQAELTYLIGNSKPRLVLDMEDGAAAAAAQNAERPWLHWPPAEASPPLGPELIARRLGLDPRDPALLVYTSGSTGRPKGALIPHLALTHAARVHAAQWSTQQAGVTLCPFPINHVASLSDICGTGLAAGGRVVFMPDFDPAAVVHALVSEGVTVWGFIPAVAALVVSTQAWADACLDHVEHAVWGGGSISQSVLQALRAKGLRVSGCYGSTETVGNVCFSDPDLDTLEQLLTTVGRPSPQYRVRLRNAHGSAPELGELGEIEVEAAYVFTGYLDDVEATERTIVDGWVRTGDLAVEREDGRLQLVGRTHEMFKSGGFNVYPREIEQALEALSGVHAAAVVPVPDPIYGEVGHAFIVGSDWSADGLRSALAERLARYKLPKAYTLMSGLPMLPVGKPDKQALQRLALREAE